MKLDPLHYPEERLQNIISLASPKQQRIIALAYASGARVSELNQIIKEDVTYEEGYMKIACKVLKKRTKTEQNQKRIALVRMDEKWIIDPIEALVSSTPEGQRLVPYNRITLFRWLKKATGLNPHMFRAIRATHLAQKGYTAHQLKHFFGWSSVSPSDYYVKLNTEDLRY